MRSLMGSGKFWAVLVVLTTTLAVAAQEARPRANRGRARNQGGVPLEKARPNAGDPLAPPEDSASSKDKSAVKLGLGTYHYTLKLRSFDGTPLASSYYPSKLGSRAPAMILVHETNRSRKDFEDSVLELKGKGLAEHLQDQGYAVFSLDLRGQGQNPRRTLKADDREAMVDDLQAVYQFLLDRHNRGDLNIAKLGVVGVGEGANLASAWAFQPGAAVSTEGRPSDVNALVLVSPAPEGSGYLLGHVVGPLALRLPLFLMAGSKDEPSKEAVEAVRKNVERGRLNKIEMFPSSLHGYKLLRLEPKAASALTRYLDANLKLRPSEWEPRYNLTPVAISEIKTVRHDAVGKAKAEPKADEKAKAEPKADEKAKADEPAEPKADEPKKS